MRTPESIAKGRPGGFDGTSEAMEGRRELTRRYLQRSRRSLPDGPFRRPMNNRGTHEHS